MENKSLTYYILKAISEIVFIFIGIYLAIWFDDQNSYSKNRELEKEILNEIRNNLINDEQGIISDINFMEWIDESLNIVSEHLKVKKKYEDSLDTRLYSLMAAPHFNPNRSGYEDLLSQGIELVLDDSLRRSITNIYESEYNYYFKYESERQEFIIKNIEPELLSQFLLTESDPEPILKPMNYNKLLDEGKIFSLISFIKVKNNLVLNRAKQVRENIKNLSNMINFKLGDNLISSTQ